MKKIIAMLLALSLSACEDRFYKNKYDIEFVITNKTKSIVSELKIDGANGAKVWILNNLNPEQTKTLRFNIKRDLRTPEGGFIFSTINMDGDSLSLNTGYFTNWGYTLPNPSFFNIYEDKIELQK